MVNWTNIKTANNRGKLIPLYINKLLSADEDERENAASDIEFEVCCSSTLYEGAYNVIDLIVELLEKPYTVDRRGALSILAEIAISSQKITLKGLQEDLEFLQNSKYSFKAEIESIKERIKSCNDPNDIPRLDYENELIDGLPLDKACQRKLKSLKSRILKIEVRTEREADEKETLIESIDE